MTDNLEARNRSLDSAADTAWDALVEMRRLLDRDRTWRSLATFGFLRRYVLPTLRTTLRLPRHQRELDGGRTTVWTARVPLPWPSSSELRRRLSRGRAPVDFIDFEPSARELGPFGYLLQELTWGAIVATYPDRPPQVHVNSVARQVLHRNQRPLESLLLPAGIGPAPLLAKLGIESRPWRPLPAWMPDLSFHFHPQRPPTLLARGGLVVQVHPLHLNLVSGEAHFELSVELILEEGGPHSSFPWRPGTFCWMLEKVLASREHATRNRDR